MTEGLAAEHSARWAASVTSVSDTTNPSDEASGNPSSEDFGEATPGGQSGNLANSADQADTPPVGTSVAEPSESDPPAGEPRSDKQTDAIDLDVIERDLNDVQAALDRLNDGTYWVDEVTGDAIPDEVLAAQPTSRSAAGLASEA